MYKDTQNPPGKEEKVPGSFPERAPSAEEEKHHEETNPPGKEEKHPSIVSKKQAEPISKAICETHNASKEVYCEDCDKFFCCRCMVDHLRVRHNLRMFKSIDDLKEDLTTKLGEKIAVIQSSQTDISKIKSLLVNGAADFRDDKKLDALYKEIEANLKTTINERKKEKNELYSRMNRLVRELDTKECSHTTKLNSVQEDKKKISKGQAETVIEWTEKLVSEGVFGKEAERQKRGEAKDVNKVIEDKKEAEVVLEAEDKKETEVPKVQEPDNNAAFKKRVQEILDEADKVKKEEMKSTLQQIEMKVIHKFYNDHFKDEIDRSTKLLEDYKRDAKQLDAEIKAKQAFAKNMEDEQAKLQKQIQEVQKQIADGRSYLNTINVKYYTEEDEKIKQKIRQLNEASEAIIKEQAGLKAQFGPLLKDVEEGRRSLAQMKVEDFEAKAQEMKDAVAERKRIAGEIKAEQDRAIEDLRRVAEESKAEIKRLMEDCKAKADALKNRTGGLEVASGQVEADQARTKQELKAIAEGIAITGKKALEEIEARKGKAEELKAKIEAKIRDAEALKVDHGAEIAKVTQIGEDVKGVFAAQKTDLSKCSQCGKAKCIACGKKCDCGCEKFYCKDHFSESIKYPFLFYRCH